MASAAPSTAPSERRALIDPDKAEEGNGPAGTKATPFGQLNEQEYSAHVAGGKVITLLMKKDQGECVMSKSVYDAAIVMPQICRSAGSPKSLLHLAIRSFLFLFINFTLQGFILYMICQEELVMDKYAGEMHLCNFGAGIQDCPDGPNCIGPSGTNYQDAGRMYSYDSWSTRTYVRDSLKAIFPHKADEIHEKIDPGEYGLENYWVRFVCVFIFMMSVMSDLRSTMDMITITWYLPTSNEPWMEYKVPEWNSKDKVKEMTEKGEMDFVHFRFAGMPLPWKIVTWVVIIIPKLLIWYTTSTNGATFLMETSGIEDVIVNVTALTFILNLDEMIFELFSHKAVHHILDNIEPFVLQDHTEEEGHTAEQSIDAVVKDKARNFFDLSFFPVRPFLTLGITIAYIGQYYMKYCVKSSRGGLVSKDMHLPANQVYPLLYFLAPFLPEREGDMYWNMPEH